jgi:hypothetical protein
MECNFECVEQTSAKYSVVGIMHVNHIEDYKFCFSFWRPSKDIDRDIEPTGSILLPPKPYIGFVASFSCFLSSPI